MDGYVYITEDDLTKEKNIIIYGTEMGEGYTTYELYFEPRSNSNGVLKYRLRLGWNNTVGEYWIDTKGNSEWIIDEMSNIYYVRTHQSLMGTYTIEIEWPDGNVTHSNLYAYGGSVDDHIYFEEEHMHE